MSAHQCRLIYLSHFQDIITKARQQYDVDSPRLLRRTSGKYITIASLSIPLLSVEPANNARVKNIRPFTPLTSSCHVKNICFYSKLECMNTGNASSGIQLCRRSPGASDLLEDSHEFWPSTMIIQTPFLTCFLACASNIVHITVPSRHHYIYPSKQSSYPLIVSSNPRCLVEETS